MKRFIMTFIFCFSLAMLSCSAVELQSIVLDVRDYDEVSLPAGTFVGVESAQEISTQYCPNGYKASFITTNDYYVDDVNIIPTNTTFIGYVDRLCLFPFCAGGAADPSQWSGDLRVAHL